MRQHRAHWNRVQWTRKTHVLEGAESPLSSKSSSKQNTKKDDLWNSPDAGRMESSGAGWDAQAFDPTTFFDENQKIFQWDDCGALDVLRKAEAKLHEGLSTAYADYEQDSEQFLASIDWNTRWSCNLAECAEAFAEPKKKNAKVSSAHKEQSGNTSPVIIGLPGAKDDTGRSATPSLHLPLDFMPVPTGWDEAEENPRVPGWEDSPMESMAVQNLDVQIMPPSKEDSRQLPKSANAVVLTGSGWPELPSSYKHIVPSGWDEVQADPPVIPSGWEDLREEAQTDVEMHEAYNEWASYASQCRDRSGSGWGNCYPTAESREIYGSSHLGKQQNSCNNSYKYGYWRPKRTNDNNTHEPSGRRTAPRSGRSISTMYKVHHEMKTPRLNRWERSKSQWQSTNVLSHEDRPSLIKNPGGGIRANY